MLTCSAIQTSGPILLLEATDEAKPIGEKACLKCARQLIMLRLQAEVNRFTMSPFKFFDCGDGVCYFTQVRLNSESVAGMFYLYDDKFQGFCFFHTSVDSFFYSLTFRYSE